MKKVILLLGVLCYPFIVFSQDDYCTCTDSEPSPFLFMVKEITKTLPPPVNDQVNPFSFNEDWGTEPEFIEAPKFEEQSYATNRWDIQPMEQFAPQFSRESKPRINVYTRTTKPVEIEQEPPLEDFEIAVEAPEFEEHNFGANPWDMEHLEQNSPEFTVDSKPNLKINTRRARATLPETDLEDFEVAIEEPMLETVWEAEETFSSNDIFASNEIDTESFQRPKLNAINIPGRTTEIFIETEVVIETNNASEQVAIEVFPKEGNLLNKEEATLKIPTDEEKIVNQKLEKPAREEKEEAPEDKKLDVENPTPPPIDFLDPEDDYKGEASPRRVSGERDSYYSPDRVKVKKKVKRFRLNPPKRTGRYKGKCPFF